MFRRAVAVLVLAFTLPACAHVRSNEERDFVFALVDVGLQTAVVVAEANDREQAYAARRRASAPTTPGGIPAEQEWRARQQRAARERAAVSARNAEQMSTLPLRP